MITNKVMKKRTKPLILKKYELLLPRLHINFPRLPDMQHEYNKRKKGYKGELQVDYHLETLPPEFTILQDVCLQVQGRTFQMDNLVITQQAIYIVDVKNYNGTIIFDTTFDQFTRDDGKVEMGFSHPITQVELQQSNLQQWLLERNLPNIPIYYFIAISDPSTIIKVEGDKEIIAKVVAHGANIPKKIMDVNTQLASGATFQNRKMGHAISKESTEFDMDIMTMHGIKSADLLPGVECPDCGVLGIKRVHSGWKCYKCKKKFRDAHKPALAAYLLFVTPWITNSECMRFLKFNAKNVATRLLREYGLFYDEGRRRWIEK
ncbi:DNA-directed RNA polymerase subunit RPC12/RpoP [Virgibacillus natechei]|uniref:DNA-directed RNA polymerase subunit RPC12/RpoP n=1 Tax=Virgibacillus natechei TaxID=1216297 RepID=A0ABS4IE45_9BACI|nr:NERD domain-containing protein [Virgibacillus natechei]MBP1969213.1 DNA-directed RNA polymerase subunit RPC12/RpoP [Virgibacillus natechei]UZD12377.1 NERD domain-containing protein [Virgibacillus natechei]